MTSPTRTRQHRRRTERPVVIPERATARHRADVRPSTPLGRTDATHAHPRLARRGPVASPALAGCPPAGGRAGSPEPRPARAATRPRPPRSRCSRARTPRRCSRPASTRSPRPRDPAPAQAKVTFEHSAFKAPPQHRAAAKATPAGASRADIATISRSLARQAFVASQPTVRRNAAPATPRSGVTSAPRPWRRAAAAGGPGHGASRRATSASPTSMAGHCAASSARVHRLRVRPARGRACAQRRRGRTGRRPYCRSRRPCPATWCLPAAAAAPTTWASTWAATR